MTEVLKRGKGIVTDSTPSPVDRHRPRFQFRLRALVALIAGCALILAVWVGLLANAKRQARLDLLRSDLQRARDRSVWAKRMLQKGYVSERQAENERASEERARALLIQESGTK